MEQNIKDAALDYMQSHDGNFYAEDNKVTLYIGHQDVDVESVWRNKDDGKVYLHVGCKEFEGDLDIESLSEDNQKTLRKVFRASLQYRKKERLLQETIVLLAADIYQTIYDSDSCDGWGDACDDIIRYAKQFEKELDWQDYDDRDYIQELDKFEEKILKERGLKD